MRGQFEKKLLGKNHLFCGRNSMCQGGSTQTRQPNNSGAGGEGSVSAGKLRQINREHSAKY